MVTNPSWSLSKEWITKSQNNDWLAMYISPNFTLKELIYSADASRANISQQPTLLAVARMTVLVVKVLQPIRDHFGLPLKINSCYRSKAWNEHIGGSKNSSHCCNDESSAADIEIVSESVSNLKLAEYIRDNMDFDKLILENYDPERLQEWDGQPEGPNSGWVHISYNALGKNRKEVLRMVKDKKGKAKYYPGLTE